VLLWHVGSRKCFEDNDCDTDSGEKCWDRLPPPEGCPAKLFEMTIMVGLAPGESVIKCQYNIHLDVLDNSYDRMCL
jgi:hypothetical protein